MVKPRLFAGNLSGFDTLLSGAYIGMLPAGKAGPRRADRLRRPRRPAGPGPSDVPGRTFLLKADRIGSITLGSPIFYRDLDGRRGARLGHRRHGRVP